MSRPYAMCLLFLTLAAPAAAQSFETVGARALGMGGAFVGVADDVTAVWWNPAGLASGNFFGLAVEHHRFDRDRRGFGLPLPSERSSFFLAAGSLPLGLSYIRTRETYVTPGPADEPVTRDLVTHQAGVTLVQSLSDTIVVAGTLKYVRGIAAAGPAGLDPDSQGGHAFDADLALMAITGDLKVGVTARNLTSPTFHAPDGTPLHLPWRARIGASYLALPQLTVAVDFDLWTRNSGVDRQRMLALGSEYRLTRVALRAGARFDAIGDVNPLGTVGGSYAVRNGMWVDVWAAAGAREADRGWGLAGRIVY